MRFVLAGNTRYGPTEKPPSAEFRHSFFKGVCNGHGSLEFPPDGQEYAFRAGEKWGQKNSSGTPDEIEAAILQAWRSQP